MIKHPTVALLRRGSLSVSLAVLSVSASAAAQEAASAPSAAAVAPAAPRGAAPARAPAAEPASASRSIPPSFSPYRSLSNEELAYEYEHHSLGGPIALTVVGGSVSALALPTFLFSGIGALVCAANEELGDCTPIDTVAAVSGISTAVFGTMTIVGVIWLANRSQERTAIKNEMWRRQSEGQTASSLTLGLSPARGGSMLTLSGRF